MVKGLNVEAGNVKIWKVELVVGANLFPKHCRDTNVLSHNSFACT